MKISLLAPFNPRGPEVGLMYLLSSFLREGGSSIHQLKCNGVFSQCDRDGEFGWKRTLSSCLTCMQQQRDLTQWGVLGTQEISKFVDSAVVRDSVRWVNSLAADELMSVKAGEVVLSELFKGSIMSRFGIAAIDPRNKSHETYARKLALATLRAWGIAKEYVEQERPELILLSAPESFLGKVFALEANRAHVPVYAFVADFSLRCVAVQELDQNGNGKPDHLYHCPLLIEDVASLRSDVKSWSPDLIRLLEELRAFLGVQPAGSKAVAFG